MSISGNPMLETLQGIVQEVSTAADLNQALKVIVHQVKAAIGADACSVYLFDERGEQYVLMATEGLDPAAMRQVRYGRQEGLIALVGERQEPIHLKNASDHPRYRAPEKGEERYRAFLGVPIIHYRKLLGVLVAQQTAERLFDSEEIAFLITIAAQLSGTIAHATIEGAVSPLSTSPSSAGQSPSGEPQEADLLQGVPGAPGIAIGVLALPFPLARLDSVPDRAAQDIAAEEAAFQGAIQAVRDDLRQANERMASVLTAEERGLFDAYGMLLGSNRLISGTLARIQAGQWAPGAWRDTIREHAQAFEQMEDRYLRSSAEDIRQLGHQVFTYLSPQHQREWCPEPCVLVADEMSMGQIAELPPGRLAAIVCVGGSAMSHMAILARGLGIPAVLGLGDQRIGRLQGREVIVDGYQGRVYVQLSEAVRADFQHLIEEELTLTAELRELRDLPAETLDGTRLPLFVKAGLLGDHVVAKESGAEGVGLYRSEFSFMARNSFPCEDEQYAIYREMLQQFAPRPVIMRTLDIGGDKALPYFPIIETNPFLGWRGIRVSLDHPEIFMTQLRAMLRANAGLGNLQIMFPMVTTVDELDEAMRLLERALRELAEEGPKEGQEAVRPQRPPLGVMIEVPAAAHQAERFARKVDFLSIGTNDLTQYLLAVDRSNARVARLYDSLHPTVLHSIRDIIERGHRCGRPVGLCGEMAEDPAAVPLLLAMGIDHLTAAASGLNRIKRVIRGFARQHAQALLDEALELDNPAAIRRLMHDALDRAGLRSAIWPGR